MPKGLARFLVAVLIIVVPCVIFAIVKNIVQRAPTHPKTGTEKARPTAKLPSDIPLYEGGSLLEVKNLEDSQILKYVFSLASPGTLKDFYSSEMVKRGWSEYAASEDMMTFQKGNGDRRVRLTFGFFEGKGTVSIEITDTGGE